MEEGCEVVAGRRESLFSIGVGAGRPAEAASQHEADEVLVVGLVVLLHGINGNAAQAREIAVEIASTGDVVCIAVMM